MNNKLLDHAIELLGLKNDAALSRILEVAPPVISKIRHGLLPIGPTIMIRLHETTGLSIADIKFLAGIPRVSSVLRPSVACRQMVDA